MFLKVGSLIIWLCTAFVYAVRPAVIEGTDFIDASTGNRIQIIGVAYQPGGSSGYDPGRGIDPLSDGDECLRDAALMQDLGINAIRVYNVNPDLDHDLCASIFNAAGIRMILDVNSPLVGESINREAPWTTYTTAYLNRTFAVVEAFKGYPNTLAFFAGNEVIDDEESSINAPYMRAVARDLKNYISINSDRYIPVGYSAADVRSILLDTWNYLQCTTTGDIGDASRVDLFALNSYSWCGNATFSSSGYDDLTSYFADSSVPVFLSEYGCNEVRPREWSEIGSLYGSEMRESMSGGVIYEWTNEDNEYGLVELSSNGDLELLVDYENLQSQLARLNFQELEQLPGRNLSVSPPECTASLIQNRNFPSNFTLPATPSGAADLIKSGLKGVNQGEIIEVKELDVQQKITDANGDAVTGLALRPLADNEVNTPTRTGNGGPSSTATGSGATTSTAGAIGLQIGLGGVALGMSVVALNL